MYLLKTKSSTKIKIFNILFLQIIPLINIKKKNNFIISPKPPKISIFLPIYNKAQFLIRSIESIRKQTLKNIEIIAVNDGSNDNSLKILKKLSKKDKRIKITNNDRNHGLLYSRAMGILNSTGEYVMNLDPDDKLKDAINLEQLYYKAKKTKSDLIIFLIERIPTNIMESDLTNIENKYQLQRQDFRITNKLIKKNIILKAYEYYNEYIYRNKWNFHEDSVWNLLVRKFANKISIFNESIYIYKRNNQSLNFRNGNLIDIKNRIYRLKLFNKFYKIFKSNIYYNDLNLYLEGIISICNSSLLNKESQIRNGIIQILLEFLNIFKTKLINKRNINNILNKISNNKVILFINSYNKTLINYLDNISIFKCLQEKNDKNIITIDINNNTNFDTIFNYIYSNDIFVGMDNIIYNKNFKNLSNHFYNNKILIFSHDINFNRSLINLTIL